MICPCFGGNEEVFQNIPSGYLLDVQTVIIARSITIFTGEKS